MKRYIAFALLMVVFKMSFSQQYFDTLQLRKSVAFMSDDDKMGRLPDSDGSNAVASFIVDEFKHAGLKLLCNDGYQPFSYYKGWKMGDTNMAMFDGEPLQCFTDYAPACYFNTSMATLNADVVAVGNGKKVDWSKCEGKWVLLMPDLDDRHPSLARNAIKNGAGGVIIVDTAKAPQYDYYNTLGVSANKVLTLGPVVKISEAVLARMLAKANMDVDNLRNNIKKDKDMVLPLGIRFEATTNFYRNEVNAKNVVALLEGSDPVLKNEYIVVGAHYDHVGYVEKPSAKTGKLRTYIYNGADDNASGTVGMVELAKKYASQQMRPKRSIIFVAFDAEEEGLLGSDSFFDQCIAIDTSMVKAMVNLDMIGRYNPEKGLKIIGANSSKEGVHLVKKLTKKADIKVKCEQKTLLFSASDHINFYRYGIPVFFFNTDTHKDYHRVSDEVQKIDFKHMQQILMIADELIDNLANRKKNLRYVKI